MIQIRIPFKTPTINHLYGQHGVRKYLKPEAKELRKQITEECQHILSKDLEGIWDKILSVHVEIYEDWYCKNKTVKRKDVSNREKFLIDSVFDAIGIDDKMIFKHTMEKIQVVNEEYAIVTIEEYK